MGKHSADHGGLFGRNNKGPGSRRPLRRRLPGASRVNSAMPRPAGSSGTVGHKISSAGERRQGPLESAPERLRAERERRSRRNKRIALIALGSIVTLLVFAAVGVFAWAKHLEATMQQTVYKKEKLDLDLKKAEPAKPFNVLLLGFDKRAKDEVYRSDTLILARVDPQSKQVWLLSIPRDTKVKIPGHGTRKINDAYALGQEKLAIETVEGFTGVPIHHFMGINFKGFRRLVDAMGGVWVDVSVEIDDPEADATPDDSASQIDPGFQLLDGDHALTFVRTRHTFVDQDFGRMRNQQTFFLAVADQIANKTSVAKLPRIVAAIAPYISTDMSLMEMMRTAQALQGAGSKRVYTETVPGEWESPYVVTDEEAKEALLEKFNAGVPFKEVSAEATETAGAAAEPELTPADVSVSIRNGAGIAGCAKQASSILKAQAFEVGEVGNAGQFVYETTLVVYKDDKPAAELVASALHPGVKLVQSRGMYAFDSDILVVIGKDWDISKVPVTPVTGE